MGSLSKQMRNGGGPRPRTTNRDPLRKIERTWVSPYGAVFEVLECGHYDRQKHDLMGPTNAVRRRCRDCALGRCGAVINWTEETEHRVRTSFCKLDKGHAEPCAIFRETGEAYR